MQTDPRNASFDSTVIMYVMIFFLLAAKFVVFCLKGCRRKEADTRNRPSSFYGIYILTFCRGVTVQAMLTQ